MLRATRFGGEWRGGRRQKDECIVYWRILDFGVHLEFGFDLIIPLNRGCTIFFSSVYGHAKKAFQRLSYGFRNQIPSTTFQDPTGRREKPNARGMEQDGC